MLGHRPYGAVLSVEIRVGVSESLARAWGDTGNVGVSRLVVAQHP